MVKNRKSLEEAKGTTTKENKRQPKSAAERQAARREKLRSDPIKYQEYLAKQRHLVKKRRQKMSPAETTFTRAKKISQEKRIES